MLVHKIIREWDACFLEISKNNKRVGRAMAIAAASLGSVGICVEATLGIDALKMLPGAEKNLCLAWSLFGTSMFVGVSAVMLAAGRHAIRRAKPMQVAPR